jgi:hypothetical protein
MVVSGSDDVVSVVAPSPAFSYRPTFDARPRSLLISTPVPLCRIVARVGSSASRDRDGTYGDRRGGPEACSMRTVAERLQVTARALHRHVSAKDDPPSGRGQSHPRRHSRAFPGAPLEGPGTQGRLRAPACSRGASALVPIFGSGSTRRSAGRCGNRRCRRPCLPRRRSRRGVRRPNVPFAVEVTPFLGRFAGKGLSGSDEQFGHGLDLLLTSLLPKPQTATG